MSPDSPEIRPYRYKKSRLKLHEQADERVAKVMQLRLAGLGFEEIAKQIGCAISTAYGLFKKGENLRDRMIMDTADRIRAIESSRLDKLQAVWWPRAVGGTVNGKTFEPNDKAAKICISIIEKRAKLWGLGASVTNVNVDNRKNEARVVVYRFPMSAEETQKRGVVFDGSESEYQARYGDAAALPETESGHLLPAT